MSGLIIPLGGGPWSGGVVTENATCVLAHNPGPMTLDGTNTWVLRAPGESVAVVVDPGPDDDDHRAAILAAIDGARVERILLTHGHHDHSEGARSLADAVHAPVLALDPEHRFGAEGVTDGEVVVAGSLEVAVVATPGHTADSLTFHLRNDAALLTGDTVLGRGTTVVAYPDGRLDDYFHTLDRLSALATETEAQRVLPGHGPVLADPAGVLAAYRVHRHERLDQVRAALAQGAVTADDVVRIVYSDVPRNVWPAAKRSVLAQLAYLDRA